MADSLVVNVAPELLSLSNANSLSYFLWLETPSAVLRLKKVEKIEFKNLKKKVENWIFCENYQQYVHHNHVQVIELLFVKRKHELQFQPTSLVFYRFVPIVSIIQALTLKIAAKGNEKTKRK